jgi:hypothetical protein
MSIDTIVNVTVTRQTRAPSQRGFGTPCIVAYHTKYLDRIREYSDASELVDDGFATTDAVYEIFSAMMAQDPSPASIKVGRRASAFTKIFHVIPRVVTAGTVHTITWDGTAYNVTVQPGDAAGDVVDDFVTAMTAMADGTPSDGTTHLILTGDTPGKTHSLEVSSGLDILDATVDPGLTTDLDAIEAADDAASLGGWYGTVLDSSSAAEIEELADWIESRVQVGLVQSADWNVKNGSETTDIASEMQDAAYTRTFGLYKKNIGEWAAAAWVGHEIPRNPGQATWAYKTLATIEADALSTSEKVAIEAKNWSHYTTMGGVNVTFESATPAGEFIDIIPGIDFCTTRMKEAVFTLLTSNPKIPFTSTGIETIRSAVFSVLKLCSSADYPIFDPLSLVVTAPRLEDTTSADRANRVLRTVTYSARLQGAVHKVVVNGTVYV